jgi:hypothetical protein
MIPDAGQRIGGIDGGVEQRRQKVPIFHFSLLEVRHLSITAADNRQPGLISRLPVVGNKPSGTRLSLGFAAWKE